MKYAKILLAVAGLIVLPVVGAVAGILLHEYAGPVGQAVTGAAVGMGAGILLLKKTSW